MREDPGPSRRSDRAVAARRRAPGIAIVVVGLGLSACSGSSNAAIELELSRLRGELHRARETAERADARATELEARVDALSRRMTASKPPDEVLPVASQPRRLPVVRIGGRPTQDPEPAADEPDLGARDRGEPPVMIRIRGQRSDRLTVDREVLERPDPVLDRVESPERAYQEALGTLRESKDPAAALARFKAFLHEHPDHRLADNALYWSGESLQMLVEHAQALETFERLLARHPRSSKVPWAMLRAAESHLVLGRRDRGRALLKLLRADHPDSEPAQLAQARLKALASADR